MRGRKEEFAMKRTINILLLVMVMALVAIGCAAPHTRLMENAAERGDQHVCQRAVDLL